MQRIKARDQQKIIEHLKEYNELPEFIPLKSWYLSKTLWANVIAIISIILASHTGLVIDAELTAVILSTINILLRMMTKTEIKWSNNK